MALPFISIENEKKALNLLKDICCDQLKLYPTTIEEDERLLGEENLTHNQRNCIIFRVSEKNTLKLLIDAAQRSLKMLEGEVLTEDDSRVKYFTELKELINQTIILN